MAIIDPGAFIAVSGAKQQRRHNHSKPHSSANSGELLQQIAAKDELLARIPRERERDPQRGSRAVLGGHRDHGLLGAASDGAPQQQSNRQRARSPPPPKRPAAAPKSVCQAFASARESHSSCRSGTTRASSGFPTTPAAASPHSRAIVTEEIALRWCAARAAVPVHAAQHRTAQRISAISAVCHHGATGLAARLCGKGVDSVGTSASGPCYLSSFHLESNGGLAHQIS